MQQPHHAVAASFADVLRHSSDEIVRRWLARITDRVAVEAEDIFPSQDLLDHIPLLIEGVAAYLEDPAEEISIDTPVVIKAMELGRLRHSQGFNARQILWEFEVLGGVILNRLKEEVFENPNPPTVADFVGAAHLLFRALSVIERATMVEYLNRADEVVREREERLRSFNRALSHEIRNEIGAILGAARLLDEPFVRHDAEQHGRFVHMVLNNAERMGRLVDNLIELSQIEGDSRSQSNVLLTHAVHEVARQLRAFAETHQVDVHIDPDMPEVEVSAAAVELCLSNLISNAVKYHDPAKTDRWVRVSARLDRISSSHAMVRLEVRDNGRGVPEAARDRLFERFYRAQDGDAVQGTGLGLSLVRDTVESMGCRTWAEFPADETVFVFTLPARREGDA